MSPIPKAARYGQFGDDRRALREGDGDVGLFQRAAIEGSKVP
jgi:hypothetical protein